MANKFYVIVLFLLISISCNKDKINKVSSEENIEIKNNIALDTKKSSIIDEEQKKSKQDINGNVVFNYKTWHPGIKDGASNIHFSGSLIFYNLNVKDTENTTKKS